MQIQSWLDPLVFIAGHHATLGVPLQTQNLRSDYPCPEPCSKLIPMARLHHQHTWLRIALLALLISMQGFSSAHEITQGATHDSSVCVTCSIGSGSDGIPTSAAKCTVTASNNSQPVFISTPDASATLRQTPEARAPPVTL